MNREEILNQIEFLLGSVGIVLGSFFAVFLLLFRKRFRSGNVFLSIYLLAFSLRIGKSLFHNYFFIDPRIRTVVLTTLLAVGPAIFLYTKSLVIGIDKGFKGFLHFIPVIILPFFTWMMPNDGSSIFGYFYDFLTLHMMVYALFSLWWLKKKDHLRKVDHAGLKNWLYTFLVINFVFLIFYFLVSETIIPFYMGISILFSVAILFFSFFILLNPSLIAAPLEKYKASRLESEDTKLIMDKVKTLMDFQKPYLEPEISLLKLSGMLGISQKELSQVINQTESLNFSQFISMYRVKEVQRLLTKETHKNFKIASIAYECGFNSISTFNVAFKKHTGLTPAEYKNSLKNNHQ